MRISRRLRRPSVALAVVLAACLTLPAADQSGNKSKSKGKLGAAGIKALDFKVEKLRTTHVREMIEIASQFEDAGQYERAKAVLEEVFRLEPKLPGLKEKLEQVTDKAFDSQEEAFPFDVSGGWTPIPAIVTKGKPVRVEIDGEYNFQYSAKVTGDGVTAAEAGRDYFDTIPLGAVMAVVISKEKSSKPTTLKPNSLWTPPEDGQVVLKLNAPTGHKCTGKLTVRLSGLASSE